MDNVRNSCVIYDRFEQVSRAGSELESMDLDVISSPRIHTAPALLLFGL
jgi:hypothetical protein